uniref:Uncharacterized protein n=1 Tax=Glossina pallidipes TaxID=7398 RepID=A0A1B0A3R4_GLOPL
MASNVYRDLGYPMLLVSKLSQLISCILWSSAGSQLASYNAKTFFSNENLGCSCKHLTIIGGLREPSADVTAGTAGLLPRWGGAAPTIHAIMNGDRETGSAL